MRKATRILKLIILSLCLVFFVKILIGNSSFAPAINVGDLDMGNSDIEFKFNSNNKNLIKNAIKLEEKNIIPVGAIDEIVCMFAASNITVLPTQEMDIIIEHTKGDIDCYYRIDKDELIVFSDQMTIVSKDKGITLNGDQKEGDITIYIPETLYHDLYINSASSKVKIETYGDSLEINTVSGDVEVLSSYEDISLNGVSCDIIIKESENITTRDIECNTISGDLILKGSFNLDTEINSVSGKVSGINNDTTKPRIEIEANSVSGDIIVE